MSTSPQTIVNAWLDAANRQDSEKLVTLSDPEIEIVGPRGSARGASVLRDWLRRAGLTLEHKRTFTRGAAVVVEHHGIWRSVETGEFVGEADVVSRFEVAGERVTAFGRYDNLSDALSAAGLDESDATDAA